MFLFWLGVSCNGNKGRRLGEVKQGQVVEMVKLEMIFWIGIFAWINARSYSSSVAGNNDKIFIVG